ALAALSLGVCSGVLVGVFFFSSRRRHTRWPRDWSSDVCSSDLIDCHRLQSVVGGPLFDWGAGFSRLGWALKLGQARLKPAAEPRSEERRVGKECRSRWSADY